MFETETRGRMIFIRTKEGDYVNIEHVRAVYVYLDTTRIVIDIPRTEILTSERPQQVMDRIRKAWETVWASS